MGNQIGDPRIANPTEGDFGLLAGSAAFVGIQGNAYGAIVPAGAWISGEPQSPTSSDDVTLTVGGPGIFAYQYRVNGGPWSATLDIGAGYDPNGTVRTDQIVLSDLSDGDYSVEVIGRDFAGNWQQDPTSSQTFTVQSQIENLLISEVLATNQTTLVNFGSKPDLVELHNAGSSAVNLRGMSLTDDPADPTKFVFDDDLVIQPGDYLSLLADDANTPGLHLGFSLRREGEGVFLYAAPADQPGDLLDSVEFGLQIPDFSIGRVGIDRSWALTEPTFGGPNQLARTGDATAVVINEWLADGPAEADFIELYNPDPLPVDIGRFYLSDAVDGSPARHQISPLSFIGGRDFTVFRADGNPQDGTNHLDFGLSLDQETLGLSDPELNLIDAIVYQPQTPGLSQGRSPDGGSKFEFYELPSPGWGNGGGFPGDFNRDAIVNVDDVDLMCGALRAGAEPLGPFDLNRDALVSSADLSYLIETILGTSLGDANLDGRFNSTDFVLVFQAGQYEDSIPGNSTWATGDWNCDGEFSSSDFVTAFRSGAYTAASAPAAATAASSQVAAGLVQAPNAASQRADSASASHESTANPRTAALVVSAADLVDSTLRPVELSWPASMPADRRTDEFFASSADSEPQLLDEEVLSSATWWPASVTWDCAVLCAHSQVNYAVRLIIARS